MQYHGFDVRKKCPKIGTRPFPSILSLLQGPNCTMSGADRNATFFKQIQAQA